ncbi:mitochondrial transcription rescue factor 1 [Uranotaenia lowii]|uniref:mitochondrial transcription rescue factor 1 n=1 Tax=Uranotaenia lowii TaxID=190385 RepID=UPI0024790398|nr:mitochondrial transcription rescue factor 1 [Uranotaenia lowii]
MSLLVRKTLSRNTFNVLRSLYPLASFTTLNQNVENTGPSRRIPSQSSIALHNHQLIRWKSKKSAGRSKASGKERDDEDDSDDEAAEKDLDEFDDLTNDKHNRVLKTSVGSMRADLILKAGLGVARNKIETMFYESKIRVNGKKLLKKSALVDVGDEIDIIRGISPSNADHLIVSRVEILAVNPRTESISVSMRRHKSLIIENYESDHVH